MSLFTMVKRGYNPQEVDEYIATLEQVVRSYKEKDAAIKNAIVSAQVAADNIIKNAHLEAADYKARVMTQLRHISGAVGSQRTRVQQFQESYNELLRKYLHEFSDADTKDVLGRIDSLESFLHEINTNEISTPAVYNEDVSHTSV